MAMNLGVFGCELRFILPVSRLAHICFPFTSCKNIFSYKNLMQLSSRHLFVNHHLALVLHPKAKAPVSPGDVCTLQVLTRTLGPFPWVRAKLSLASCLGPWNRHQEKMSKEKARVP